MILHPPSLKITGLSELNGDRAPLKWEPVSKCESDRYATARCRPEAVADSRGRLVASKPSAKKEAEGEDGWLNGTTVLPKGLHLAL